MKENKYDNDKFFEAYSRFPRSVEGLNAAGEWHELEKMLPDFQNKRVLDIGCGFGWHCIYAAEHGASSVIGTDISEKMLEEAVRKTNAAQVEYRQLAMEDLDFAANSFDVVLSSLAFHYAEDFDSLVDKIYNMLSAGGDFIFSVEHPVFTAYGTQDWYYEGDSGDKLHWPVDNYFYEGKRNAIFLGEEVVKYHRTMTSYLGALLKKGFAVTGIVEPQPAEHLIDSVPGMRDELRRPMMLLVSAKKM